MPVITVSASTHVDAPVEATRRRFRDPRSTARVGGVSGPAGEIEVIQSDELTTLYAHSATRLGVYSSNDVMLWESDGGEVIHEYVAGDRAGTTLVETFHAVGADRTVVTATVVRPTTVRSATLRRLLERWHRVVVQRRLDARAAEHRANQH